MKQSLFTLEHARQLTADTYELVLSGDTSAITAPGQFVNIQLPGKFLRRPISICNWTDQALMLLVKVVGDGTRELVRAAGSHGWNLVIDQDASDGDIMRDIAAGADNVMRCL